jgi:plasmid stabilization system protein ParE
LTRPLRILDEAESEIRAVVAWYEEKHSGLGADLLHDLGSALRLIQDHPEIGNRVRRLRIGTPVRRVPLRRFPYFVVYRDRQDRIEIIALAHASRRPGYWRFRG